MEDTKKKVNKNTLKNNTELDKKQDDIKSSLKFDNKEAESLTSLKSLSKELTERDNDYLRIKSQKINSESELIIIKSTQINNIRKIILFYNGITFKLKGEELPKLTNFYKLVNKDDKLAFIKDNFEISY